MSEPTGDLTAFAKVTWPVSTGRLLIPPVAPDDPTRLYSIRALPEVTRRRSRCATGPGTRSRRSGGASAVRLVLADD